jgi:hypothetical protein
MRANAAFGVVFLILALATGAVRGANFFVWNYDPADLFFDPQVGDSVDGAYRVGQTLASQGHSVAIGTALPEDLSGYQAVFCLMGWFRC